MSEARQLGGTAFALRDPLPWPVFAGLVREAAIIGYRGVFLPEISGRDAFAALTALAGETDELMLGTGIVPMTSRTARLTAMAAATVQERSGGRMILGLGTGAAGRGALDVLAAQIAEIRGLFERGELSLLVHPVIPIWMSALGPKAVALAGRVADGVLLNWCTPERVAQARLDVRRSAEQAGRDPDAVSIAVYVRAAVDVDPGAALDALRSAFGEYAAYAAYARQFAAMGLGAEALAAAAAHRAGRPQDIPSTLVDHICLVGDTGSARARLRAYRDAGAEVVVVYPALLPGDAAGASISRTLHALAPGA